MTISEQIQAIIDQVKTRPNSYPKNKTISNLEDARVWAKELDMSHADPTTAPCKCINGKINTMCPTHGWGEQGIKL